MYLKEFVKNNLIISTPKEISAWHWSSWQHTFLIKRMILKNENFDIFNMGSSGRGLYLSCSAVDNMERGNTVSYFKIKAGSRLLVIHPIIFHEGMPEIWEWDLAKWGWTNFALPETNYRLPVGTIISDVIEDLHREFDVDGNLFAYGMHLACTIRKSKCIIYDPNIDADETVLDYHRQNPEDIPMLAPQLLKNWLLLHVPK